MTFSKENKKIVTLTQKEITLRLTKVLTSLSGCGCLGVLLSSLNDQDDLLVVKKGIDVIKSLTQFLDKYNYWTEMKGNDILKTKRSPSTDTNCTTNISNDSVQMDIEKTINDTIETPNSDDVIQSIVSAQDINLLSKAYENQMSVEAMDAQHQQQQQQNQIDNKEYFKQLSQVTPQLFMDKVKTTNLDDLIKTRTEWLAQTESFSSLLNDMLYSLEAHESHDADCY